MTPTAESKAYLNGQFLPSSQLNVPVFDAGFVLGATVTEQLRTFGGRLFRLEAHLERLAKSLQIVGIEPRESPRDLAKIAHELVVENSKLIDASDDLGLAMFVTPGPYAPLAGDTANGPTVGLHTYRLPYHLWVEKYQSGESLVTTAHRQVPGDCWPPELKCRSRMHYYLADREAGRIQHGARALLLDEHGCVCETSTANIAIYNAGEGLVSPPAEAILPGISLLATVELCRSLAIPFVQRTLTLRDVAAADEVMLTSTPYGLLSVTEFNQRPIADGQPGKVYQSLLAALGEMVGVNLKAQAERFAKP